MKTIALLTSTHSPFDDRIFHHQAASLSRHYKLIIIASTDNIIKSDEPISISSKTGHHNQKEKINYFIQTLKHFRPEIIVSSEPLTVYASAKYRTEFQKDTKIIYDITEWYPSKKNFNPTSNQFELFRGIKLLCFNIFAAACCHGFIFGEYHKGLIFRILFPFKKWKLISYYPDLTKITYEPSRLTTGKICLGYTGKINHDKGISNVFNVANRLKEKSKDTQVILKIIGRCHLQPDQLLLDQLCHESKNITIELLDFKEYNHFSQALRDIDILLDLRLKNLENNYCLPIKVFYYAACGKPVIYSNLNALKRIIDVNQFGYLVKPDDVDKIADHILNYINNKALYAKHSDMGRMMAETTYNWQAIENDFLSFVNKFQS